MTERVFICGSPGTGKSTKARALTAGARRRISFDPSRDWGKGRGVSRAATLQELSNMIAKRWRDGFDITYTPPRGQGAAALHRLSELLLTYQWRLFQGRPENGVSLVVDEMAVCFTNAHVSRADLGGFNELVTQSRHVGISVYGLTQQPATAAAFYRSLCELRFFFRLHDANERDVILKTVGRAHRAAYEGLADFQCLTMRNGVIGVEKLAKQPKSRV